MGLSLGYRRNVKGNGTWKARLRIDGKYIEDTLCDADDFADANGADVLGFFDAQTKAKQFADAVRLGNKAYKKPPTVAEAVTAYLEWFRTHRRSVKETETTISAHILPMWGNVFLHDITTPDLKRWHQNLATNPPRRRAPVSSRRSSIPAPSKTAEQQRARKSTANRVLSVLKAILNKAFQDGLVANDNPWRRVKPFSNVDEPVVRFLSPDEARALLSACAPDLRSLVEAALLTGCRFSELARIKAGDVNLDRQTVHITSEAKSGRGRHVPLNEAGKQLFAKLVSDNDRSELVFRRPNGSGWGKNHHVRPLQAANQAAGIAPPIRFHELRHTYASQLAQQGVDLLTISKLLGHADTRITARHYAHLSDQTLRSAVEKLPSMAPSV
ncbi:MAG: tyrosine-type recombinase/integrase [Burkholderiales bacterium]